MSAGAVKAWLGRHGVVARKDLGQNFLVDASLGARLVDLAGVAPGDLVIEIGTGLGALTRALASRAARVVTLEVDAGLVRALRAEGELAANVELVHADALKCDLAAFAAGAAAGRVRLVANLPYSASAPLLRRLLDLRGVLADWSVMLQSEVARRLLAAPGSRAYGSLAVLHRLCVDFSKEMELSPNCFYPVPKVHSTFVRITPRAQQLVGPDELPAVERVLRAAFAKRRKTIINSLRDGALGAEHSVDALRDALARARIDPMARAEVIEPERLLELARALGRET